MPAPQRHPARLFTVQSEDKLDQPRGPTRSQLYVQIMKCVWFSGTRCWEGCCAAMLRVAQPRLTLGDPMDGSVAHQAPLSMGFFRQEYCSGLPCPPPGDLPNPGIEPRSLPHCRQILYHLSHQGSPKDPVPRKNTCRKAE